MDLKSVEIISERLKLVPISFDFTEAIFQEFTTQVTNFIYPKAPERIEETKKFIGDSLEKLKSGRTLPTPPNPN